MTDKGPSDTAKWAANHPGAYRSNPGDGRIWPSGPVGDALWAIVGRLNAIQHECAREGTSLMLQDPRDLASVIERLGKAAQLEGFSGTFEMAGAYAVAGWVVSTRAEDIRVGVDLGGDAA